MFEYIDVNIHINFYIQYKYVEYSNMDLVIWR